VQQRLVLSTLVVSILAASAWQCSSEQGANRSVSTFETGGSPSSDEDASTATGGRGGAGTGGTSIIMGDLDAGYGSNDASSDGPCGDLDACANLGCGNGKLDPVLDEACDDGNSASGDGCSADCKTVETDYACPEPGKLCTYLVVCGDGKVGGKETCDDHNTNGGDGCSMTCELEAGWSCLPGGPCSPAKCGDGIKVGYEQCDDGNGDPGDGCSAKCLLESPGPTDRNAWECLTPGQLCTRTVCGDGKVDGSEQCDDKNNDLGDKCTPYCRKEPVCPPDGGACVTSCGDGLLLPVDKAAGQKCDDGNTLSGDGCSQDCAVEAGYDCEDTPVVQDPLILPVVYRDFKAYGETNGHPDFERYNGKVTGIVLPTLNAQGKPVHAPINTTVTTNNDTPTTPDYFGMWYTDTPAYNKTIPSTLTFTTCDGTTNCAGPTGPAPAGAFQFSNLNYFPIDGQGWGNYAGGADCPAPCYGHDGKPHNFHFTSEVRYWFEYRGGEQLDFLGDDDLWVFINKRLAIDIGGVHGPIHGAVTLNGNPNAPDPDPTKDGKGLVCDLVTTDCNARRTVDFGLVPHSVYEIVVFQAERRTQGSRYTLTLTKFSGTRSTCKSVCGDGVVTPDEACDLGKDKNTGEYNGCTADCKRGPSCGDKTVQQGVEECDDGANVTTYSTTGAPGCAPGCVLSHYCGDGKIDGQFGEACDLGKDKNTGEYNGCTAKCQLGPRCGDGVPQGKEECDDGNTVAGDGCTFDCRLEVPK
jgi:cysteine-rich repeat protein